MNQLKDIPHNINFAHISITRIGDSRNTDYRVSQREPVSTDPDIFALANEKYVRGKYGHIVKR